MSNPPAGWYPDPTGQPDTIRWWNGTQWTSKTETEAPAGNPDRGNAESVETPATATTSGGVSASSTGTTAAAEAAAAKLSAAEKAKAAWTPVAESVAAPASQQQTSAVDPNAKADDAETGQATAQSQGAGSAQANESAQANGSAPGSGSGQGTGQGQSAGWVEGTSAGWQAGAQQASASWQAGGQQGLAGWQATGAGLQSGAGQQWQGGGTQAGVGAWDRGGAGPWGGGGDGGKKGSGGKGGSGAGGNKTMIVVAAAVGLVLIVVAGVFFLLKDRGDQKTADPGPTAPVSTDTSTGPSGNTSPGPTGGTSTAPSSAPTQPTTKPTGPQSSISPGQSKNPRLHAGSRIASDAISFPRQKPPWSDRKRLVQQLLDSSGQYVLLQENFDGTNDWYADMFVGALGTGTPFDGNPQATAADLSSQVRSSMYGDVPVTFKPLRNGSVKRSGKNGWYYQQSVTANTPKISARVLTLTVAVFDLGDGTAVAYISDIPTNRPDLRTAESQVYKGINVG